MGDSLNSRGARQRIIDLPVGRKLLSGFIAVTAVLALVMGCLFLTVARLGSANDLIVDVAGARSQAADHLRFAAAELRAAQQGYVLGWPSPRIQFDRAAGQFEVALQDVRQYGGNAVGQALIQKIATGYQTFLATDQLIWQALQDGRPVLARNLTLGAEDLAFGFIADDASKLSGLGEISRVEAVNRFHQTSSEARTLGIVLGIVALMVMALASWVITKLIRDPLHRVQRAAERAANGDLQAVADVIGNDETGRLARAFNEMLSQLRLREAAMLSEHRRQETLTIVQRAFEMADDESSALDVVALSLTDILPGQSCELLLADNSKSNLERAVVAGPDPNGPGCPVASPFSCVAVRSGSAITFPTSSALDACPHLRNRGIDPCSAVCVPVTFMGRAMGVIHAVGTEHAAPSADELTGLTVISAQAGARIGMLRTMVRTQEQASTDSLTGLMNRRTFQTRMRALHRRHHRFTLVMADIDRFKAINDTYGHETGDRAIKTFCEIATAALRDTDLVGRWGGEEFTFAFVDLDPEQTCDAIDRIRLELSARLSTSDLPGFTVSFGLVEATRCPSLDEAVKLADNALYEAKAQGRNRCVIALIDDNSNLTSPRPAVRTAEELHPKPVGILASLARDDDPLDD